MSSNFSTVVRHVPVCFTSTGRTLYITEKSVHYNEFYNMFKQSKFVLSKKQAGHDKGINVHKIKKIIEAGIHGLNGSRVTLAKEGGMLQVISGNHITSAMIESYDTLSKIKNFSVTLCTINEALRPLEAAELSARYNRAQSDDAFRARVLALVPCGLGEFVRKTVKATSVKGEKHNLEKLFGTDFQTRLAVLSTIVESDLDRIEPHDFYDEKPSNLTSYSGHIALPEATPYVKQNTEEVRARVEHAIQQFETLRKILSGDEKYTFAWALFKKSVPMRQVVITMVFNGEVADNMTEYQRVPKNAPFNLIRLAKNMQACYSSLVKIAPKLGSAKIEHGTMMLTLLRNGPTVEV